MNVQLIKALSTKVDEFFISTVNAVYGILNKAYTCNKLTFFTKSSMGLRKNKLYRNAVHVEFDEHSISLIEISFEPEHWGI